MSTLKMRKTGSYIISATVALLFVSCGRNDNEIRTYDVAKTAAAGRPSEASLMKQAADAPAADSRPPNSRSSAPGAAVDGSAEGSSNEAPPVLPPSDVSSAGIKWDAPSGWTR